MTLLQLSFLQETGAVSFFPLVPWVVFFPVAGILINLVFGRRLPGRLPGIIASTASGLAFVVAVLQAVSLAGHPEGVDAHLVDWITIGELYVPWAFRIDTLSVTMMLVVSGVGTLIHIYAIGYMAEDVHHNDDPKSYVRFFIYFNLFIAFMMVLVSANNFLMLFVGWEGVGLCSYLLIGFWFWKGENGIGNAIAAKKAFVVNRIGDFGFLIAMFLTFWAFRSLEFEQVFARVPEVAAAAPGVILGITLFMLLGVTGKSAQIPLFVWLPDAMAGPTPVSALIHAATMVTAGVYLVTRSAPLFVAVPQAQTTVAWVGGLTALLAATIAMAQFDIKKVLAYSTVSQLGFMVAAVGMGAFVAGMFHLITHAFFKALLFLSAGSVIQGMERGEHHVEHDPKLKKGFRHHGFDVQDMRNMGGLRGQMRTTFLVYTVGALALAGLPFITAGFWSKDEILAEALHLQPGVFILLAVTAFLTAFYSLRQIILVFFGQPRNVVAQHAEESPPVMTVPLIILAVLSVIGGFLNTPFWHGLGSWLEETLAAGEHLAADGGEAIGEAAAGAAEAAGAGFDPVALTVSIVLALGGIVVAWYLYTRVYEQQRSLPPARRPDDPLRGLLDGLFTFFEKKWLIDELYWTVIVNPFIALARFLADVVDWRFWHDWFHDTVIAGGYRLLSRFLANPIDLGVIDRAANWLADLTKGAAGTFRNVQTGFVRNYALSVFVGVVIILGYLMLR